MVRKKSRSFWENVGFFWCFFFLSFVSINWYIYLLLCETFCKEETSREVILECSLSPVCAAWGVGGLCGETIVLCDTNINNLTKLIIAIKRQHHFTFHINKINLINCETKVVNKEIHLDGAYSYFIFFVNDFHKYFFFRIKRWNNQKHPV